MRIEIRVIVAIIIDNVFAEKIYLLPCNPVVNVVPMPLDLPKYHFLVLTSERGRYDTISLQRLIEKKCNKIAVVNLILFDVHSFKAQLYEQSYFFPELFNSSIVYDYGHVPITLPPPTNNSLIQRSLRQSFRYLFNKSEISLTKAISQWGKGIMNLRELSESICNAYLAVEVVYTGHEYTNRGLLRLRNSTARFSSDIAILFPYHSQKEKYLLYRMNKLSLNKPTKEKKSISAVLYEGAIKRAEDVRMVSLIVCQQYINSLGKSLKSSQMS